jgi:peptide/nickel transport system permease protein
LLSLVILGILEPIIDSFRLNGRSPTEMGLGERFEPPSLKFPLGTDFYGWDVFGALLASLRYTFMIGATTASIALATAIILSFIAGYKGGVLDRLITGFTDFWLVLPSWPILMILATYAKRISIFEMSFILGIFGWPWTTRTLRSQVLSLKERSFIDLAKVSGLRDIEIMFKEIMVNMIPYIIVSYIWAMMNAILTETAIRFLGLGPATIPTLGYLIYTYILLGGFLLTRPFAAIPLVILLCLIFFTLNMINTGIEDICNPRLKRITGL